MPVNSFYFVLYFTYIRIICFLIQLIAYFAERMISGETLRRNGVMQRRYADQVNKI